MSPHRRRYPVGAELLDRAEAHVRVWAPDRQRVEIIERRPRDPRGYAAVALDREADGYFSGVVGFLEPGGLYSFRIDGAAELYPDPASRFQPDGPHGPSELVDASEFRWKDAGWRGVGQRGQVIYELHLGTFTREGTLAAAERELDGLRELGVTVVELMPVADFPGRFGWGYDGVNLWAPSRLYGRPDDLRHFIDRAHALGLGVILDVVYNHVGPDGNYLKAFSPHYFSDRYTNEWGDALNFDGPNNRPVREFFRENAAYWLDEFHFDGLRLDATQSIHDASEVHILAELVSRAREVAPGRSTYFVAENERQHALLARPRDQGGYGIDALWNDDFHHSAHVAATGHTEAYYTDYRGSPQEFISAIKWGYLYQGQHYSWQKQGRGRPALDLPATSFVTYLQNHDQVANSARGLRMQQIAEPSLVKALTALLLLAPPTPMLFQGQEFGASNPFLFFADHQPELAALVRKGRAEFLSQFPSLNDDEMRRNLADPSDPGTFERCKLDPDERRQNRHWLALHRDLLRMRRDDPAFAQQRSDRVHGSVLGGDAFLLRFCCERGDRLLCVNLGRDLELTPCPEPLLAPPEGRDWKLLWSSEAPHYGGGVAVAGPIDLLFRLPGRAAVVFG
jgi:maltooligosyltrehalose trehalohydrolase